MSLASEIAVIGGGIAGSAAAFYLNQSGLQVTLIERDGIASHASGFSFGGLFPLSGFGVPGPHLELARYGFDLHKELAGTLQKTSSTEPGYRVRSNLNVAFSREEAQRLSEHVAWVNRQPGFSATALSRSEVLDLEPHISPEIVAGSMYHDAMDVDSKSLCMALVESADVDLVIAEVVEMKRQARGPYELSLNTGEVIQSAVVIFATGPWLNTQLTTHENQVVNVQPLKGEILRLSVLTDELAFTVGHRGNYFATKQDGLLWAGTTEQSAGFDEDITSSARLSIWRGFNAVLPGFEGVSVEQQTACLRPVTADHKIVLGQLPYESIFVCSGGARKGILFGPAMGQVVADLVMGRSPRINIEAFNPIR